MINMNACNCLNLSSFVLPPFDSSSVVDKSNVDARRDRVLSSYTKAIVMEASPMASILPIIPTDNCEDDQSQSTLMTAVDSTDFGKIIPSPMTAAADYHQPKKARISSHTLEDFMAMSQGVKTLPKLQRHGEITALIIPPSVEMDDAAIFIVAAAADCIARLRDHSMLKQDESLMSDSVTLESARKFFKRASLRLRTDPNQQNRRLLEDTLAFFLLKTAIIDLIEAGIACATIRLNYELDRPDVKSLLDPTDHKIPMTLLRHRLSVLSLAVQEGILTDHPKILHLFTMDIPTVVVVKRSALIPILNASLSATSTRQGCVSAE